MSDPTVNQNSKQISKMFKVKTGVNKWNPRSEHFSFLRTCPTCSMQRVPITKQVSLYTNKQGQGTANPLGFLGIHLTQLGKHLLYNNCARLTIVWPNIIIMG